MPVTIPGQSRPNLVNVALAVGVLAIVFAVIANLGRSYVHSTSVPAALLVTAILAACGVVLGAAVRLASGYPASTREWISRSLVGAVLLTPAALLLTRTFLVEGWGIADCGTLLEPYRPTAANLAGFRSACDAATGARMILVVVWAVVACAGAAGYGLRLRYRRNFDRAAGVEEP